MILEDEHEQLAQELSFQASLEEALETKARQQAESLDDSEDGALIKWADFLEYHFDKEASAAGLVKDTDIRILGAKASFTKEWSELDEGMQRSIQDSVIRAVPFRKVTQPNKDISLLIIVSPCRRSTPPRSLCLVYKGESKEFLVQMAVQRAANLASRDIAVVRCLKERFAAYQQMAFKMAQICAGSVALAQMRLQMLLMKEGGGPDTAKLAQEALNDLRDAQKSLDRARLFGSKPPEYFLQTVSVGEVLAAVGKELNGAVKTPMVDVQSLKSCERVDLRVQASPLRMQYAFRDLLLGTWALADRKPVKLLLQNSSENSLEVTSQAGEALTFWRQSNQDSDLMETLRSPDFFMQLREGHDAAERSLGLQNAIELLQQSQAVVNAHMNRKAGKLTFLVRFPTISKASPH